MTSANAWTLVVQPLRKRPMAWAERPHFAPNAARCAFRYVLSVLVLLVTVPASASGSNSFSQSPGVTSGSTRSRPWWTARNRPGNRTSGSRPSAHAGCRRSPAGRLPCALPAGSSTSAARWLPMLRPTIRTAPRAAFRDYTRAESGKPLRLNTLIGFRHYAHFSDQLLRPHVLLAS